MGESKDQKFITKQVKFGDKEITMYSLDGVTWSSRREEVPAILERHEKARVLLNEPGREGEAAEVEDDAAEDEDEAPPAVAKAAPKSVEDVDLEDVDVDEELDELDDDELEDDDDDDDKPSARTAKASASKKPLKSVDVPEAVKGAKKELSDKKLSKGAPGKELATVTDITKGSKGKQPPAKKKDVGPSKAAKR